MPISDCKPDTIDNSLHVSNRRIIVRDTPSDLQKMTGKEIENGTFILNCQYASVKRESRKQSKLDF